MFCSTNRVSSYFNLQMWKEVRSALGALDEAFRTIIDLMPEKFREVSESYYECEIPEDAKYWEAIARSKIIDLVTPVPEEEQSFGFYLTVRASCPLLRSRSLVALLQRVQFLRLPVTKA